VRKVLASLIQSTTDSFDVSFRSCQSAEGLLKHGRYHLPGVALAAEERQGRGRPPLPFIDPPDQSRGSRSLCQAKFCQKVKINNLKII
jgi:hypothetical protein